MFRPIAILINRQWDVATRIHCNVQFYLRILTMIRSFPKLPQAPARRTGMMAIAMLFIATSSVLADTDKNKSLISLTGVGTITAAPDIALVTGGVISQAKTAAKALAANSAAMTRIINDLKASDIAAKDIQTTGFSVNPTYFYDQKNRQNSPKIIGYRVHNQVKITVRQRDRLGALLDQMIKLGANQIHSISFDIDKTQTLLDEARKRAVKDALRKAEIYVAATDSTLGRILSISEGQAHRPAPVFADRAVAMSPRSSVPVEAGGRTLSIQVNITWELD